MTVWSRNHVGRRSRVAGDVGSSGAGDAGDAGEETQVLSGGDTGDEGQGDESSQQTDENSPDDQKENSGDEKGGDARKLIGEARAQIAELRKTNPSSPTSRKNPSSRRRDTKSCSRPSRMPKPPKPRLKNSAATRESPISVEAPKHSHIDKSLAAGDLRCGRYAQGLPDGTPSSIVDGVGKLKTLKPEAYAQLRTEWFTALWKERTSTAMCNIFWTRSKVGSQGAEARQIPNDFMQHHKTNGAKNPGLRATKQASSPPTARRLKNKKPRMRSTASRKRCWT